MWESSIENNLMFRLTEKLKKLKGELKSFHVKDSSHILAKVRKAKEHWLRLRLI